MSCDLTPILVTEYLTGDLSAERRQNYDNHVAGCESCRSELAALSAAHDELAGWHDRLVPEWSRTSVATSAQVADVSFSRMSAAANKTIRSTSGRKSPGWRPQVWQWLPLAASLLLAVATLAQTRISVDQAGWTLSFGASINRSAMVDDRVILERQRSVDTISAALRQHQSVGSVHGRYLPWQGIVLEISEPQPPTPAALLTRPDLDAVRDVYALSLAPGETERAANMRISGQQAERELQLFSVLCDVAGDLWMLPQHEYVSVVLSKTRQGVGTGDRILRLSGDDLQACQQGRIDAVALQQKALGYGY